LEGLDVFYLFEGSKDGGVVASDESCDLGCGVTHVLVHDAHDDPPGVDGFASFPAVFALDDIFEGHVIIFGHEIKYDFAPFGGE
jgi:hypothetical protein